MTRTAILQCAVCLSTLSTRLSTADELKLTNGNSLDCVVLQEDDTAVTVLRGAGVVRLDRSHVVAVQKTPEAKYQKASETLNAIPPYADIIRQLSRQSWAVALHAIPATVIEIGELRHIPYKSHRVAADCEINVYGDPLAPSCVEVGLFGRFLNHDVAKQRCIEFVASLFDDSTNRAIILAIKKEKYLVKHEPLTFEITPSTAADAYGGWWISVYNERQLELVRVGENELDSITTVNRKRPEPAPKVPPLRRAEEDWDSYHPTDFHYARIPANATASSSVSGGRVYVHGYTRKDGTYVHPHTRKK